MKNSKLDNHFWAKYFRTYDVLLNVGPYTDTLRAIAHEISSEGYNPILDVGSGTGNLEFYILDYLPNSKLICIDASLEGIKIHQKKEPSSEKYIHDITKRFLYQDGYFSTIVSNNSIYFFPPNIRGLVFQELYRLLKPGGRIIVSNVVHNFSPLKIYSEHFKTIRKKRGLMHTLFTAIKLARKTFLMFMYNKKIKDMESKAYFFEKNEQMKEMDNAGFKIVKNYSVYAGQAELTVGIKP